MKKDLYFDGVFKSENDFFVLDKNFIFGVNDIDFILNNAVNENQLKGNSKKLYYYNIPCSFDIETTSFYRDTDGKTYNYKQIQRFSKKEREKLEKLGIMYVWQLGINGFCLIGRTWKEFIKVINYISEKLQLNENKRLIIYVHNLAFEFQFICKLFTWKNVFSTDLRKPLYALTENGVEFRCSYFLSGYNLETLAKNLTKYKIKKLVGDLDYSLIRHEKTPLNENEMQYCLNDIKIIMLYIREYLEKVKNIHNIPLTKTGAVRKFCRKNCFTCNNENYKGKNYRYKNLINDLQINDIEEFNTMQRAFMGGFTHANANYTDKVILNVSSYDFTSSYPAVMVSEKYPMSKGKKIAVKNIQQFNELIKNYLCIFDCEFINIFSRETFENYLSVSKCFIKENFTDNNGRLVCAGRIVTTITNIDYDIIKNFYKWESFRCGYMYIYEKNYLPTEFVKSIIELYKQKTELKGIAGKESEYLNAKEMLNSCYGMSVTNPMRNEFVFDILDGWKENKLNENQKIEMLIKYNTAENRFLFYIWGVFVTAYARRNLFTAISELKTDYIYSDTDSVKFINIERHLQYFETYNKIIQIKLKNACDFHGISFENVKPKNLKGKEKILGIWDFEGTYEKFKTLGAKRYMIKENNALSVNGVNYNYSLTVSGVNKKFAIPYLLEKYGDNIFNAFTNYLVIPENATGKNILTYIDYETNGEITDYNGIKTNFNSKSGVHLEPTNYTLNLAVQYIQYISGLKVLKEY